MVKEQKHDKMEVIMKENGKMVNEMVKEQKSCRMEVLKMVNDMVKDQKGGQM